MSSASPACRFDPFRALSREACERHLAGYLRFLRQLDGDIDLKRRTLSLRERFFENLQRKLVESETALDVPSFHANVATPGRGDLDRRTAWLVVAAKANSGECYGVERELAWIDEPNAAPVADELHLRILLQEAYHSRILFEACRTGGVQVRTPLPHWNQRVLIEIIMRLPDSLRWTLVISGEVVGCAIFEILLRNCDAFASEPEVEERLRSLLLEIWRDEVLHVAYLRARLGRARLAIARSLVPIVARLALLDLPALPALGTSRRAFLEHVGGALAVPSDASWMEPDPALSPS